MKYVTEELSDRYIRDAVLAGLSLIKDHAGRLTCDPKVPEDIRQAMVESANAVVDEVINGSLDWLEINGDEFIEKIKLATAEMMKEAAKND